jgi:DNA-binding MarR family transcriptional regulator
MVLQKLQTYFRQHHNASLAQLEQDLHINIDVLRGMLDRLVRKGRIRKTEGKRCGSCHSCAPETIEFYEWTGS